MAEAKDEVQNSCSTALSGIDAPDGSVRGSPLPLHLNAARTNRTNYQAKPHQASRYARWGRVGRVAGPVGAVISGVGAGADQWSQDQQNHPEMRTAGHVGRTATVGATVGGGALVGAAIGGVAGSELGKVVGDAIKEPIGKATQAVSDAVSEGASKIGDGAGKVWDSVFG